MSDQINLLKINKIIIYFISILLALALVVVGAIAQKSSKVESEANHPKKDYSLASAAARHPLKPPDTSSPRATLHSFIENVNRAHSLLMATHRRNLKTPGFFTTDEIEKLADNATSLFKRGVWCLDLSEVPAARKENVGYEATLKLKEILDRIELPPIDQIPDAEAIATELEEK